MKDWFKHGIFLRTLGRIWGSAAVTFLISMLPTYIWRGSYHGGVTGKLLGEDIIMTVVGLACGFLVLLLMQSRRKDTLYRDRQEIIMDAAGGVILYVLAWMLMAVLRGNNYLLAFCGYHLSYLLGRDSHNQPAVWASAISAVVYGGTYLAALLLGAKLAHKRAKRIYEQLKENAE